MVLGCYCVAYIVFLLTKTTVLKQITNVFIYILVNAEQHRAMKTHGVLHAFLRKNRLYDQPVYDK